MENKDREQTTVWGENLDRTLPLNEYPRPNLVRERWINLNGLWEYAVTGSGENFPDRPDGDILVPFSIETPLSGAARALQPEKVLRYRRTFTIPGEWEGSAVRLNFEAVDWKCRCFINGRAAGEHRGGYIPFGFDISSLLEPGENSLEVMVEDPTDSGLQQRGKQVLDPGYIYYTATSGIWQTVWLEPVPGENSIENFICLPGKEGFSVKVEALKRGIAEVEVLEEGKSAGRVSGAAGESLLLPLESPRFWSPEDPFLYEVRVRLITSSGELVEEISSYTAYRHITRKAGRDGHERFCLNGKSVFLHGPLDQGYWPESGMTAPSDDALVFDIQRMKDLGFNMIRKHIKIESRRWYYHADRLGMMVIQDMVSGGKNRAVPASLYVAGVLGRGETDTKPRDHRKSGRESLENREEYADELTRMIRLLINHPSIVCWVSFNESWGQFDSLKMTELVRSLDPTRLVDHASGWIDQGGGDFYSQHRYKLKLNRKSRREKRIHMLSEYGGYNLNAPGHMWDEKKKFGYRVLESRCDYEAALESLILRQLIPLIPKGLSAAVYTQLSDVEIESNGFFTYDRRVLKCGEEFLLELNNSIYRSFEEFCL
ncbi:MAG: glycoside hydrolase family 2 TIM barrel-domain containing protein [Spirochaetales bacterium]|nr:glycoside hydrolase family 2 TIM barrel-domain containing protein [Spirochaetales bacterium]